jgi:hypothetical protein
VVGQYFQWWAIILRTPCSLGITLQFFLGHAFKQGLYICLSLQHLNNKSSMDFMVRNRWSSSTLIKTIWSFKTCLKDENNLKNMKK